MPRWRPSDDVRPVTEFRSKASAVLEQVRTTGRPVVLTQHGLSAAVLLDVAAYERLLDELALLRDIRDAEAQVARGEGIPHTKVASRLRAKLVR